MAYQLKADETVNKGIKRIVCKELDSASDGLVHANDNVDKAVHDTRVHFKKIRAVLRLVRDDMGDTAYRLENQCFRDAARPLTKVRDAQVQIETLDALAKRFPRDIDKESVAAVRNILQGRYDKIRKQVLDEQGAFHTVQEVVKEASDRPALWSINQGWGAIATGMRRVYKSGRRAMAIAEKNSSAANLHEWRKQAKYLWYGLETLEDIKPRALKKMNKQCHKLTKLLGESHDLDVLEKTLSANSDAFRQDRGESILSLIERRRAELNIECFELGRKIYRDRPKAFTRQLSKYWHAWSVA